MCRLSKLYRIEDPQTIVFPLKCESCCSPTFWELSWRLAACKHSSNPSTRRTLWSNSAMDTSSFIDSGITYKSMLCLCPPPPAPKTKNILLHPIAMFDRRRLSLIESHYITMVVKSHYKWKQIYIQLNQWPHLSTSRDVTSLLRGTSSSS